MRRLALMAIIVLALLTFAVLSRWWLYDHGVPWWLLW